MAIVNANPTSPGRRFVIKVTRSLHKGKPCKKLLKPQSKNGGRNNLGRLTVRHKGGGHKRHYRMIDFKRTKDGIPAKVLSIEYDPNRTANIALLVYADGEKRYILAPKGLEVGHEVTSGPSSLIRPGNCLPLRNMPIGAVMHAVELRPGKGAQLARSAGGSVQLISRESGYATVRLRSGEVRKIQIDCRASVGEVSNDEHNLRSYGKAGARRWKGIRPTVRGVAMNPVDHPHGGGEGKTSGGRHPVSPWGTPTKGYKTRQMKRTDKMIVRSRHQRKK